MTLGEAERSTYQHSQSGGWSASKNAKCLCSGLEFSPHGSAEPEPWSAMTHVPNHFNKWEYRFSHTTCTSVCKEKPLHMCTAPGQNNRRYSWRRKDEKILSTAMQLNTFYNKESLSPSLAKLAPRSIKQIQFFFFLNLGNKEVRKKNAGFLLFLFLPVFTCLKYHKFTFTCSKCHTFTFTCSK